MNISSHAYQIGLQNIKDPGVLTIASILAGVGKSQIMSTTFGREAGSKPNLHDWNAGPGQDPIKLYIYIRYT